MTTNSKDAIHFHKFVRLYNNVFAFYSLDGNHDGKSKMGIYVFQLQGDGDHTTNEPKDDGKAKEVKIVDKEVKDIQAMVRNLTFQAYELLLSSSGFHPIFVHLLAQAPVGIME